MASKSNVAFSDFKDEGVWQYFLREKLGATAQCKTCRSVLKSSGGSTKGLHTHVQSNHGIDLLKR